MAGLGKLARLTQVASKNRVDEQNFRSSLFARGRQEILQERQMRLAEGEAVANRIERAGARDDAKKRQEELDALSRERIAATKQIAADRLSGGGEGASGPFVPFNQGQTQGQGAPDITLPSGSEQEAPSNALFKDVTNADDLRPKSFRSLDAKGDEHIQKSITELSSSLITADKKIKQWAMRRPQKARFKEDANPEAFNQATLEWISVNEGLMNARSGIQVALNEWEGQVLFADQEKASAAINKSQKKKDIISAKDHIVLGFDLKKKDPPKSGYDIGGGTLVDDRAIAQEVYDQQQRINRSSTGKSYQDTATDTVNPGTNSGNVGRNDEDKDAVFNSL